MRGLLEFFLGHPLRIALVAMVFLAIGVLVMRQRGSTSQYRVWPMFAVGGIWAAVAIWEFAIKTMSPEANIRVDLLLIIPVLILGSIAGSVLQLWWFLRTR